MNEITLLFKKLTKLLDLTEMISTQNQCCHKVQIIKKHIATAAELHIQFTNCHSHTYLCTGE